jgi:acyl-lipid omega-6 desaturase (Delta-12 desaturase)
MCATGKKDSGSTWSQAVGVLHTNLQQRLRCTHVLLLSRFTTPILENTVLHCCVNSLRGSSLCESLFSSTIADTGHIYEVGEPINVIGLVCSVVTTVPFFVWRDEHDQHHAGSGNLSLRGVGDIDVLTVAEYLALSRAKRVRYRLIRNPLFLFFIGGPFYFLVLNRVPWGRKAKNCRIWPGIMGLNLALVMHVLLLNQVTGFGIIAVVLALFITTYVAAVVGTWLFYVQHQFDQTRWYEKKCWNFRVAAVSGSSFYDLPPLIRWFTGNIGMHHIHHLSTRIPNYHLVACLETVPELRTINRLTLRQSFGCARLKLWDEATERLVGYP